MTKKGPLSKAERFYIENNLQLPIGDLCKDLDRAKSTLEKYLKTLVTEDTAKTETLLYQQFARNDKGATVMTPNASEHGDDIRDARRKMPVKQSKCVTQIRKT
jgi:hypothetical protein